MLMLSWYMFFKQTTKLSSKQKKNWIWYDHLYWQAAQKLFEKFKWDVFLIRATFHPLDQQIIKSSSDLPKYGLSKKHLSVELIFTL